MGLIQFTDRKQQTPDKKWSPSLASKWLAYNPAVALIADAKTRNLGFASISPATANDVSLDGAVFRFPGVNGYIDLGSTALPIADNAHTMVAVVRVDAFATAYPILTSYTAKGGLRITAFFSSNVNYADFSVGLANSSLTTKALLSASGPVLGTWRTIVVVRTANSSAGHAIFVNGRKLSSTASAAHAATSGNSVIGQAGTASLTNDFVGRIKAFALFDAVLPDSVALALSANPQSLTREPGRIWVPVSSAPPSVTSDASLAWSVRNSVQADQALAYTLRSGVQADRSLTWSVRAGVQRDQALAWLVRNSVQKDQSLAYTLRNAVQVDRSLSWAVRNAAQADAPLTWIVRSTAQRDQPLAYGVRGPVQRDQPLAWSVVNRVERDQPLAWSVANVGTVISDQPLAWTVRSTVQRDQPLAWSVKSTVQSDRNLAWTVKSTAQADRPLAWPVRNAAQRDQALAYSIRGAVQRDQPLSWIVRSRVQRDQALSWIMRSGVQQDRPLAFPIFGATQHDQPLAWTVFNSVAADASLSWIMRSAVERDQGITYPVYGTAQRDQALAWTVASSVALPAVICITIESFYGLQGEIADVWHFDSSTVVPVFPKFTATIDPVLRGCDS